MTSSQYFAEHAVENAAKALALPPGRDRGKKEVLADVYRSLSASAAQAGY